MEHFRETDEFVRPYIINYLSSIYTRESYDILKEFLIHFSNKENRWGVYFNQLSDSLKLSSGLFPEVLSYVGSKSLGSTVLDLTSKLLDSNLISPATIKPYASKFIKDANPLFMREREFIEENAWDYLQHVNVLSAINTPESRALLAKLSRCWNS